MGSGLAVFAHAQTKFLLGRSPHRSVHDKWHQPRHTSFSTRELALAAPSSPALPPLTVFGGSGHSRSGIIRGSVNRADVDHVGEGVPAQKSGGLRLFPIQPTETTLGLGKSTRNVEVAAKRGEKKDLLIGDDRSLVVLEITCVCIGVCVCVYVVYTQRFSDVMIL